MRWGAITIDRCCLRFIVFTMVIQYYTFVVITRNVQSLCVLFTRWRDRLFLPLSTTEKAMKPASTISLWIEIGLRFIGMWPESAHQNLYVSMYVTFVAVMQYFQYTYVAVNFDLNNPAVLMDCMGLALANTLAFLKVLCLWWKRG